NPKTRMLDIKKFHNPGGVMGKRFVFIGVSLLICAFVSSALSKQFLRNNSKFLEQGTNRVLMISIDGLRPDFYLSKNYDTPVLKRLVENGAYATGLVPVFPTVTYP